MSIRDRLFWEEEEKKLDDKRDEAPPVDHLCEMIKLWEGINNLHFEALKQAVIDDAGQEKIETLSKINGKAISVVVALREYHKELNR